MAQLKAFYVAKSIPISMVKEALPFESISITRETALYRVGAGQLHVYSFGSVVFIDCDDAFQKSVIRLLRTAGLRMKKRMITEEYEIVHDRKAKGFAVSNSQVVAGRVSQSMVKVIARVLAQSVALESYEEEFERIEEHFSMLNRRIARYGRLKLSERGIMRMISRNNMVLEEIVSGIGLLDKPDAAWESATIDSLHDKLSDEFELGERFQKLDSRMEFVQENYKVFLDSFRSSYGARLEWAIIVLIAVEILLFIYELLSSGVL